MHTMMSKNAHDAGADQSTPSVPQYFSWINNTNEGPTEKQMTADMSGQELSAHVLFCDPAKTDIRCDVYLCPRH